MGGKYLIVDNLESYVVITNVYQIIDVSLAKYKKLVSKCGTIQYSYCRKVATPPAAAAGISHIDDMCRAQGWGDPM